jgi:hypothetical protein
MRPTSISSKATFSGVRRVCAMSADGTMLAVSATGESSSAMGVGGNQNDNAAVLSGAVYIY